MGTGFLIASRRATRSGISQERIAELALWMVALGLLGAHLFKALYIPGPVSLFKFGGVASFGGFAGGLIGALVLFRIRGISKALDFLEPVAFALPFAWSIGRMGCYLVHDHPGVRTSSFLGVRYPDGTRYDLGLLEVFFLLGLGFLFLLLDRTPRRPGFYWSILLLSYGSFRLLLDTLHVDPPRYFGWTVDQLAATAMITLGVISAVQCRNVFVPNRAVGQ